MGIESFLLSSSLLGVLAQPAYRAANRELKDVSELRLLLDMNEAGYQHLLPSVSALPADAVLNVNTACDLCRGASRSCCAVGC
jgi:type II secretory pathway component PulK